MGRWRAPEKPGSKYVTPAGERRMRDELEQLWRVERPQVTQAVQEAAAQGDRSENAEYTYGKKRLREIDRRVRFLRKRLDGIVVVDRPPSDPERVYFGAWVELEDERGEVVEHRIVGPDEFDMDARYVSMDAPLGRALLGRRLDDEVSVELPGGRRRLVIVNVRYDATAD
jgi:transcription elongation factor GreB